MTSTVTSTVTPAQYYKRALATIQHLPPLAERDSDPQSSDCVTKVYTSLYTYTTLLFPSSTSYGNQSTSSAQSTSLTNQTTSSIQTTSSANTTTSSVQSTSSIQTCPAAPTYASACDGCSQYTSACSCLGVTGVTTVTVPGQTTTTYIPAVRLSRSSAFNVYSLIEF